MLKTIVTMLAACAVAMTASSCKGDDSTSGSKRTRRVGGCEIETIKIGTEKRYAKETPDDAAWIRISSVRFAGNELYEQAALDLTTALAARGVRFYSRSDLAHIKEGSCWPPYSVDFRIKLTEQAAGRIRTFLLNTPIAKHRPTNERPEGYGPFFVTCGTGATDWWSVWYQK